MDTTLYQSQIVSKLGLVVSDKSLTTISRLSPKRNVDTLSVSLTINSELRG